MKDKIKILFFLPSFAGGGAEKVAITFINNLIPDYYEVHLVVLNNIGKLRNTINEDIIIHDLKTKRLRYSLVRIINKISTVNPDIIFSTFININIFLLLCKFFYKKIKYKKTTNSIKHNNNSYKKIYNYYKLNNQKFYNKMKINYL